MKINALSVAKFVVSGVVGIGTNKIVKGIIANNVAAPETHVDKVTITAASWVLSALVTKTTKNTTNEMIDDVVGTIVTAITDLKENQKLERIRKGESTFEKEGLVSTDYTVGIDGKYTKRIKTSEEAKAEVAEESASN